MSHPDQVTEAVDDGCFSMTWFELVLTLMNRVSLWHAESRCSGAPQFEHDGDARRLWKDVGANVTLNCSALLPWDPQEEPCDVTLRWTKDGQPPDNHTHLWRNSSWWRFRLSAGGSEVTGVGKDSLVGFFFLRGQQVSSRWSAVGEQRPGDQPERAAGFRDLQLHSQKHFGWLLHTHFRWVTSVLFGSLTGMCPED